MSLVEESEHRTCSIDSLVNLFAVYIRDRVLFTQRIQNNWPTRRIRNVKLNVCVFFSFLAVIGAVQAVAVN